MQAALCQKALIFKTSVPTPLSKREESRRNAIKMYKVIYIYLLTTVTCFSQNVTIFGFAPDYKGKYISLCTYSDYISNIEIPVAEQMVDDSGRFALNCHTGVIQRVLLRSEKQEASMYIEPGKTYKVFFPKRDSVWIPNPEIDEAVEITFLITDTNEINSRIISFNEKFDKFWADNYQFFIKSHARYKLDTFQIDMENFYAKISEPYFKNYIQYTFASLDYSTFASRKDIAAKYITGNPVLYDNYEYMILFNQFFNQYIRRFTETKEGRGIIDEINEKASYEGCMRVMSTDNILRSDTLRELVLIKVLADVYYSEHYKEENIVRLLDHIASTSKVEKHRTIAANVIQSFSKLKPGGEAPQISLADRAGKAVNLSDFKKKYVYLSFWSVDCNSCLEEIKLIPELKKRYGDKIIFLSVSTDDSISVMNQYIDKLNKQKKIKYDWIFLQTDASKKIKDDYEIKTLPSYFLIDAKGRFIQSPALRPSEQIEAVFFELTRDKKKNYNQIK